MMQEVMAIPTRYRNAQINQAYAVGMMSQQPFGFSDENAGALSADSMLAEDIQFVNLCLATLDGSVAFLSTKLSPDMRQVLPLKGQESVAEIFEYNPSRDNWRINLSSGNIANLPTELLSDVIEYRP